jgi:hypothetical protein
MKKNYYYFIIFYSLKFLLLFIQFIELKTMSNKCQLVNESVSLIEQIKNLKHKTQNILIELCRLQDIFLESQCGLEFYCYQHFDEIKRQIDLYREELKEKCNDEETIDKIDTISLEMIDRVKAFVLEYSKSIHTFKQEVAYLTLIQEMDILDEKFRDTHLQKSTALAIKFEHDLRIFDVKQKLEAIDQVRVHLKTNFFTPIDSNTFGFLSLNEFQCYNLFQSQIVKFNEAIDLINLCGFSLSPNWRLIYRGSRDGFHANDFHTKCDGQASTLVLLEAKESKYIFGGYTDAAWDHSNHFKSDSNAFVFSLTNKYNDKCKIVTSNKDYSIFCSELHGPIFGQNDIRVLSQANKVHSSYSNLSFTYKHPFYIYGSKRARSFLAGSFYFQLSEIEVYQRF